MAEERLLLAEAEEPVDQLLLLCPRTAQMKGLSQRFNFRGWQEIQSFSEVLEVRLFYLWLSARELEENNMSRGVVIHIHVHLHIYTTL